MVKSIPRIRKKFKDSYTYLNRNMIMDCHPDHIFRELISTFKVEDLHQYPDMFSPYKLLSKYLNVSEDYLLLTRGVEGSIKTVFESLNLSDQCVGVFVPTCAMFKVYADVFNVNFIPIKGKPPEYNISVEQVKDTVPKIKVLFLTNPMSHLENCFSNEQLQDLIYFCKQHNVIVFLDEVYTGWENKSYLPYLNRHDNFTVYNSSLYTIRLYSKNKKLVKRVFDNLYSKKIVVNVLDETNLQFSVSTNQEIEKLIFNEIAVNTNK